MLMSGVRDVLQSDVPGFDSSTNFNNPYKTYMFFVIEFTSLPFRDATEVQKRRKIEIDDEE